MMSALKVILTVVCLILLCELSKAQNKVTSTTSKPTAKPSPKVNTRTPSTTKSFYLVSTKKSWRSAQAYCEGKGDQLATIENENENNQVLQIIQKLNSTAAVDDIWLAGYCPHLTRSQCYWHSTKTPMTGYTYFHTGQPSASRNSEQCVQFNRRRNVWKWLDWFCVSPYYFVCEHLQ